MMKITLKYFSTILLAMIIFVTLILLPRLLILGFSILEPNPPTPEITYGEFPFSLEYEINGKKTIIEDVIVCEYVGIDWNEGSGKHRVWKSSFKNLGQEELLILTDNDIKIYCNVGKAEYYMGDLKYTINEKFTPVFYYISTDGSSGSARELLDKYSIKLISWQFSNPIKNSFR